MCAAFRISSRQWRHLILPPHGRSNRAIHGTIGNALERVGNAGQFEANLVGSTRLLQQDNPLTTEVQRGPEHHANNQRYDRHENIVAGYGEAPACDRNNKIREHGMVSPRLSS